MHWPVPCADQEGGGGAGDPDPPPEKSQKNIEILSNTGPDPLNFSKFSKLPSQHSTLGHHRHPSETPFKWRFAGGPMMAHFFSDMWILSPLKKRKEKNVVRVEELDPL